MSTNCLPKKNHKIIVTWKTHSMKSSIHAIIFICQSCLFLHVNRVFQARLLREILHAIIVVMVIRIVSFQSLMEYRYWYRKNVYTMHLIQCSTCFWNNLITFMVHAGTLREGGGGNPWFYHNSSIHFCCNDSLLMTHRGGLSLSIIIWRIGGGGQVSFCPGAQKFSWRTWVHVCNENIDI